MKQILSFSIACLVWYTIISFINWTPVAVEWHWGWRLVYMIIVMAIFRNTLDKE